MAEFDYKPYAGTGKTIGYNGAQYTIDGADEANGTAGLVGADGKKQWVSTAALTNQNAPNQPQATPNYTMPAMPSFAPIAAAPVYKGLMDGDYDKLQTNLAVGGRQAAENAYNTGTQNLNNTMSGRGLYGSSIMQQQQTQGLDREYMRAQAANEANAASTRYGMQQADLKTGFDGAMQGYGINTTATTAANALQGQMYMNAADIASKDYATDQGLIGQKYGYDKQANSSILHDKSVSDTAIMTNSTKMSEIQGQIDAAKAKGDWQMATDLAKGAGYALDNYGKISGILSSAGNGISDWASNLMGGSSSSVYDEPTQGLADTVLFDWANSYPDTFSFK